MSGVLVWKVYREQRLIWLAMVFLAVVVLVLQVTVLEPDMPRWVLNVYFGAIAYMYGMVVGAILLAGEREGGTAAFLEMLPARRMAVWGVKCLSGVVLVLAHVLVLWVILLEAKAFPPDRTAPGPSPEAALIGLVALVGVAGMGFAWGLFFSGRTQTSMGAVLAAVIGQAITVPVLIGFYAVSMQIRELNYFGPLPLFGLCVLLAEILILVSALTYGRVDRLRRSEEPEEEPAEVRPIRRQSTGIMTMPHSSGWPAEQPRPRPKRPRASWINRPAKSAPGPIAPPTEVPAEPDGQNGRAPSRWGLWRRQIAALIWLDCRQSGRLFFWLALVYMAAGVILPLGVMVWPVLMVLLGALAGVAVFTDEQNERSGRLLSEQRLPPGMVWTVKVGFHLILAIGVAALLLSLAAGRLSFLAIRREADPSVPLTEFERILPFLQLGPYLTVWLGYGFSLGVLASQLINKPVVAGVVALGGSLLLGMLWGPSMLVGDLHAWQVWGTPLFLLLTSRLLVWSWATGSLGARRAVVRLTIGLGLATLWFAGGLGYRVLEVPLVPDELDLEGFEKTLAAERTNKAGDLVRSGLRGVGKLEETNSKSIAAVFSVSGRGWRPDEDRDLSPWLDEVFGQPWARDLEQAAPLPLGVVEDVQGRNNWWEPPRLAQHTAQAARLLIARDVQRQAQEDPAVFVQNLANGLALVRQVRHLEPTDIASHTKLAQQLLLHGVELWLERLDKRPDLLRQVLDLLIEHDKASARVADDTLRADYLVGMHLVQQPETWIRNEVQPVPGDRGQPAGMIALAWRMPWEQARQERLVRLLVHQKVDWMSLPRPVSQVGAYFADSHPWSERGQPEQQTRLWARELMVALRLYQAETGRAARTLEELTPKFLLSLPGDASAGTAFAYRISEGEELQVGRQGQGQKRKILAGQGILTSAGWTFVVPLPPGR